MLNVLAQDVIDSAGGGWFAQLPLPMMLLLPLFAAVAIAHWPTVPGSERDIRWAAFFTTLLTFILSLVAAGLFDFADPALMQLTLERTWIERFGLRLSLGVDGVSLWLVLLTTFLMPLVVLGSFSAVTTRIKEFYFWLLILETAMLGVFVARDIILFYVCFEFTLIPLYFLIGVFGSSQRLRAARVFFLYTFTGSMLTFAGVLYVAWWYANVWGGVWTFDIEALVAAATDPVTGLSITQQRWVLAAMLAGFAVKVPLFPVHTWLPLAHTEAPTAGSVVLAGVLLKLGTYAILRLAIPMAPRAVVDFAPYLGVLAVVGILYTALICWVQKDIKKLIAYSSVSHLGFCVLGMFALNVIGGAGSVAYMINHGLSTGALFLCVGMVYERFHTREMAQMGGLARVMPVWSFFMVFFSLASVGLPGLNGFVGEFLTLAGAFLSRDVLGVRYAAAAGFGMIFAAIYILYMVGKVVFGPVKLPHGMTREKVKDINFREIVTLAPLAAACLVFGLYPKPMLHSFERPVEGMIAAAAEVAAGRAQVGTGGEDGKTQAGAMGKALLARDTMPHAELIERLLPVCRGYETDPDTGKRSLPMAPDAVFLHLTPEAAR